MNYLAHIFLSGDNTDVQIGNFMGDAIKGKKYKNYSLNLKKGALLHRQIDSFTDQHPIVRRSIKRLQPRYGHYGGVLIDIFYDHFLAINWSSYSSIDIDEYISAFYKALSKRNDVLPSKIKKVAAKLIEYNWLDKYRNIDGIARTLLGMEKRIKNNIQLHLGTEDLIKNFNELNKDFNEFFPLLQKHSIHILETLDKQYEQTN